MRRPRTRPAEISRSIALPVSYADPGAVRLAIAKAVDAGFGHVILMAPAPYPERVARWVADELIAPSR